MAYKKPGGDGWGRLGWLVLKLLSGAFEAFAEDLHERGHGALLLVEEVFVLAGEGGENVSGHERVELVQAAGGFLGFNEETLGGIGGDGWRHGCRGIDFGARPQSAFGAGYGGRLAGEVEDAIADHGGGD